MRQPAPGIQFAHKRDDRHMMLLHLLELAFKQRQIVIRPAIDQICHFCSRFAVRSVHVAHRATATALFEKFQQRRDSVFNSEMPLNACTSCTAVPHSQFAITEQLLESLGQRGGVGRGNQ